MKTIYNTLLAIIIFTFLSVSSFGQSEETLFGQGKVRFTGLWGGAYNAYTTYNDKFNFDKELMSDAD
tara:strand:+ start:930 stop:1130 length:201 start_codon:yes stop_codon:yes gene_type:complete